MSPEIETEIRRALMLGIDALTLWKKHPPNSDMRTALEALSGQALLALELLDGGRKREQIAADYKSSIPAGGG